MNTRINLSSNTRLKVLSKSKAFKNYSYLVFSFLAIIVFSVFAIRPTVKNIIELQSTIQQKQQTLQKLKDKYKDLNQAISNLKTIDETTQLKLYSLLPDSTNATCYLNYLNSLSTTHPINILGLQFQKFDLQGVSNCNPQTTDLDQFKKNAVSQTSLAEIDFTFNSNGSYTDLLSVIDAVNNSNRLTNIQTVSFTKTGDNPLAVGISGKIFFYK